MNRVNVIKVIIVLITLLVLFVYGCPIYNLLHIQCPCCGATRAWKCFFKGEVKSAFSYNLFFLIIPIMIFFCYLRDYFSSRKKNIIDIMLLSCSVVLFVYNILRNI